MEIQIGGQHSAQEIAEGDIDRRAVVEGTCTDREKLLGGAACFHAQPFGQGHRNVPVIRCAATGAEDTEEVVGSPRIDGEIGVEHRRHQHRAAIVRFDLGLDVVGVRARPERAAQRRPHSGRLAELLREPDERIRGGYLRLDRRRTGTLVDLHLGIELQIEQPAARLAQGIEKHVPVREVGEQRRQIGESLVERRNVDIGGLHEIFTDAVDDRMRRFVGDDVVRQTGENGLAGQIAPGIGAAGLEITEHDAVDTGIVEGIGLAHRMRKQIEAAGCGGPLLRRDVGRMRDFPPVNAPAQRRLESLQGLAGDRIDHLLMEARIGVARSKASGNQQIWIVEVHRLVVRLGGPVVVDDRKSLPDRAG